MVSIDDTVDAAERRSLAAVLSDEGDAARIERISGSIQTWIAGGDKIIGRVAGGSGLCSLGFNIDIFGTDHFLTAGHCTSVIETWTTPPGVTEASNWPEDDFGLVRHTSSTVRPGTINLYNGTHQDIKSAANPYIGQRVWRSGFTTGVRSGLVSRLNVTVNYTSGETARGLAEATACGGPGDSGGPVFAGTVALGLTSGGSGDCTTGGRTYFQPVVEALNRYWARVY